MLDNSLVLATALVPLLGYDASARIAKQALATGRSIREVAAKSGLVPAEKLDSILPPTATLNQETAS